jgi:arabinose-5-phosphate isomerase
MRNIKFIIFDFDGVFTDGKCYFDNKNNILKYYNIKDGMALSLIKNNNIKSGLISSYKSSKNIIYLDNNYNDNSNNEIINHLKFDYKYIGSERKIEILNKWLNELNFNYENIAYIGDDINDIEIIKKVGFSACPSDAINECKQHVDYVCNKKGGEGCVREFIDLIINKKNEKNIIQEIKQEVNYQLDNINVEQILNIGNLIKICKGNIYITGIGKSENIAIHLSNLLKSISIKSFYLNAINSLHGDIGPLDSNDIVILFSKSGKTNELINIIPFLKERNCYIIGICNDLDNVFTNLCDLTLVLPIKNEILGEINKIPTNSYMSHLLFVNILVSELKNNITINNYKLNHPAGTIGNNLKKIKDCLIFEFPKIILKDSVELHNVLLQMTKYKIGCCFFTNEENELIGILTDGDIRRLILNNDNIKEIKIDDINTNFYYETDLDKFISNCEKYNYISILKEKKIIGIIIHNN